ncbi:MAG: TonB-dependent receptor plug domain-containing protein, partial [Porticoccaceae bacterium]|nr:TonB-dependent receptor plug domain-containing protein [Porticoccaceae bacterium]
MKNPFQLCAGALFVCAVNVSAGDGAKSGHIEEVKVSASRLPIVAEGQALTTIDTADNSSLRLDDTLRQAPGFSLFRRANSLTAHPTTQGLSARGVGANGAGRVLVTLDGVPLNNPFGGWVYWSSLNQREIASVNILRGGSASAFGPQGLAGTVSLNSVIPEENSGYLTAEYGEFNSYTLSAGGSLVAGKNHLSVSAGRFDSAGPFLLSPQQRGPIDVRAASESRHLGLRGGFQLADATRVSGSLRYFDEDRTNGLAAASNTTDSLEGSIQVLHQTDNHLNWELLAYYRNTDFANVFASARDDRTTERPVLDQFDVPGRGGGLLARLQFAGFEVGVEGRQAKGETNERFRNLGQGFTRLRIAGGEQRILGVFADYHREGSWGALSLSTRLDRYRTFNGQRREQNLADGSPLRNDPV